MFAEVACSISYDQITYEKGMTNESVPIGGVLIGDKVHHAIMQGPDSIPELAHGYTYSGHPLACAAGLATLDVYRDEQIFQRTARLALVWEEALHAMRGAPHVRDIRNLGLLGAVEIAS